MSECDRHGLPAILKITGLEKTDIDHTVFVAGTGPTVSPPYSPSPPRLHARMLSCPAVPLGCALRQPLPRKRTLSKWSRMVRWSSIGILACSG